MKILVLPDIHGRNFWKKACETPDEYDRIIFLGDYLDPYGFENISVKDAIENFKEIIEFKKANPEKVVMLLGNHDMPYYSVEYYKLSSYHCRHSSMYHGTIKHLFLDNKDFFKIAHLEGGILFTHSGVTDEWYDNVVCGDKYDKDKLCEELNSLIEKPDKLYYISSYRGGMDLYSSCVWADAEEFYESCRNKNNKLSKIKQVFGHTLQAYRDNDGSIKYGNPVIYDSFMMLDTGDAYSVDTEEFKSEKITL